MLVETRVMKGEIPFVHVSHYSTNVRTFQRFAFNKRLLPYKKDTQDYLDGAKGVYLKKW